jgi:spoIIIJ-associated protein
MRRKYTIEETGPRIDEFLDNILELAGFDVDYDIESGEGQFELEGPDIVVKFSGPDVDYLLENKAEVLLSLEQLTLEYLRASSDEHSHLCFDANDHRALRMEELRLSALAAAERVRKSRVPFHFSPMNSRERRIIHLALNGQTEVRSESVGMAPNRQVVVMPADMKVPPPPKPMPPPPGGRGGGFERGRSNGDRGRGGRPGGDRRGGDRRGGDRDRRRGPR